MRRLTACLLAAVMLLCLVSCDRKALDVVPAFSEKQALVVYTSHVEEVYAPIIKEFQESTGIWVTVETGGSVELMEKLLSDSDSPVCDVMFGGDLVSHILYRECFESYDSPQASRVSFDCTAHDSHSTQFSLLPIVFVYNPKIVRQKDLPDSWEELLDSRWKGNVAFANPHNSAFCYSALVTMMQAAEGDPWRALERFASNINGTLLENSEDIPSRVIDGSYLIGISLEGAAVRQMRAGADIDILYPSDGTSLLLDCTAVVKGAPHPEAARQFIDFTVSRDIQYMISSTMYRRPAREDVDEAGWLIPTADILTIHDISDWSVENRDDVLSKWDLLTGSEQPQT